MSARTMELTARTYELEITIDAPMPEVWTAMTSGINAWWLHDFRVIGGDSTIELDARGGGQLVERSSGGASLLWYTVQMCVPGESLYLVGHLAPEWGGPATTMLRLSLAEREGGCTLTIQDSVVGHVSEETLNCQREGWGQLFGDGLKKFVESGG